MGEVLGNGTIRVLAKFYVWHQCEYKPYTFQVPILDYHGISLKAFDDVPWSPEVSVISILCVFFWCVVSFVRSNISIDLHRCKFPIEVISQVIPFFLDR